jgi:hypothetical protein
MPELVYFLCAAASLVCAMLLLRKYRQTRVRLLFWSSACFIGFAANNILLFVDLAILPEAIDFSVVRNGMSLLATLLLLYGMIWDTP